MQELLREASTPNSAAAESQTRRRPSRPGRPGAALLFALALASVSASALPQPAPSSRPARIISLVPAVTEMLFAVGAGDRVVGVSTYDRHPPEVAQVARVGALLDPDLERILSLRPDLVAVYHSQLDLRKQLEAAGIPMFVYAHAGLADVTETIRSLGERVGEREHAAQLASDIEARIEGVRKKVAGRPRPKTLIVFGREPYSLRGIYASGGTGFIHDMIAAAGGENLFADIPRESVQATSEMILARRPDIILELRADSIDAAAEARETQTWNALPSVPAVRNGRVHIITDPRTVIAGPRVAESVELLARTVHGI